MQSELPLDILINILWFLPPQRSRGDSSALTLAACLRVNSLFAEAARMPSLWKDHYESRFEHCEAAPEAERVDSWGDNWRSLYSERRRIDRKVERALHLFVVERRERIRLAEEVYGLGMDAWDVLDLEQLCPLSPDQWDLFERLDDEDTGSIPEHAAACRYWAKYLLDGVSRRAAVLLWRNFWVANAPDPSFEEIMTHLSSFFGHSPQRITAQLEDLANRCRASIGIKHFSVDVYPTGQRLALLCEQIVEFMKHEGFQLAGGRDYYTLENKFPHYYLDDHKQTIPMSLVHIFVAIATRLGIDASPINFPGTVLAHVRHPLTPRPIVVDPSALGDSKIAAELDIHNPSQTGITVLENPIPAISNEIIFKPSGGMVMLLRSINNMRASIGTIQNPSDEYLEYATRLLILQVYSLFQLQINTLGELDNMLSTLRIKALDAVWMKEVLPPVLPIQARRAVTSRCDDILGTELQDLGMAAPSRSKHSVKYAVGMPVVSRNHGRGVISSWHITFAGQKAFYDVWNFMGVSFTAPEDDIWPIYLTRSPFHYIGLFPEAARFFSHASWSSVTIDSGESEGEERRGRLVGTPETQALFPEDDAVAQKWVDTGILDQ